MSKSDTKKSYRSKQWFNDPSDPGMTALYLERYLNFGLTPEELQSDRPIVGIAQTGSDLTPCNRHHLELAKRVKDGVRDAGGIAIEFPVHPIQETGRRPTAALDRNLQALSLIEVLHGYPLDGVVLLTGCDKTTPALLMGAASVDLPAIALNVGPMLNGNYLGRCIGSGSIIWEARKRLAQGEIDYAEFMNLAAASAPSTGHCNTMGTASTMNILAEALGMMLPGSASIPAPYRERQQMAYRSGRKIVSLIEQDIRPSRILQRSAFLNAIKVCAAIGGSTNAPIHINAIAAHAGVTLTMADWQTAGAHVPQIVNCQPVGEYLCEEFHHAGGSAAVIGELLDAGILDGQAATVTGDTLERSWVGSRSTDARVIRSASNPVKSNAGLVVLSGNLFRSAVMKASAINDSFRAKYLSNPDMPGVFEARVVVFDGPEDYHARIEDPVLAIDERSILVMRGAGPIAYPGSAEVVNMQPPAYLLDRGVAELPTMGDGRQSGTSGSPSILNVSPEAAAGGGLALLRDGDWVRVDLNACTVNVQLSDDELNERRASLDTAHLIPDSQTYWQELYRQEVNDLDGGAIFPRMIDYLNISAKTPRHSH